jgi:hypothetical protein
MAVVLALACSNASAEPVADGNLAAARAASAMAAPVDADAEMMNAATRRATQGSTDNLVLNGGFSQQPNPLAFWTNAPGALATWVSEGANGSQGAVQLRFIPPSGGGAAARGAIYYTGLTQCIPIPGPGSYVLGGFSRVPAVLGQPHVAGTRWTLRSNGPQCVGPITGSGSVDFQRSTSWLAAVPASIQILDPDWTAATTIEIELQVGDSSTQTIEPVEAYLYDVFLIEGPLFGDGFEG